MTVEQVAAPRVTPSSPAEPGASFATAFAHRVGAMAMVMSVIACGCGSSSGRASAEYPAPAPARPRSDDLDPSKAPNVTSVFNVAALRSGNGTNPLLALFTRTLPSGVAIDDVDWLAVDGPGPLDSPTQNVVFVARPSAALLVIRGRESGFSEVAPPTPPRSKELLRIGVRAPAKKLRVPYFRPPASVEHLSLVVEARDDGGADIHVREHCADATEARNAAAALDGSIARVNGGPGRAITAGVLRDAKARVEGNDACLDVTADVDQVDALVELALVMLQGP